MSCKTGNYVTKGAHTEFPFILYFEQRKDTNNDYYSQTGRSRGKDTRTYR